MIERASKKHFSMILQIRAFEVRKEIPHSYVDYAVRKISVSKFCFALQCIISIWDMQICIIPGMLCFYHLYIKFYSFFKRTSKVIF